MLLIDYNSIPDECTVLKSSEDTTLSQFYAKLLKGNGDNYEPDSSFMVTHFCQH